MAGLAPLAMSQTKDDLLRHLNMAPETYSMMAKEADRYYKWLTQERRHLKKNCKRKPPYDWSDINEKSKDEAMELIAQSGDSHTSYYWNLAARSDDCPNWIARWFLYHKFRYRDGRNRNAPGGKGEDERGSHHHSSSHSRHKRSSGGDSSSQYYTEPSSSSSSYYPPNSMVSGSQQYYSSTESSSSSYAAYAPSTYPSSTSYSTSGQEYEQDDAQNPKSYYDPVRDV